VTTPRGKSNLVAARKRGRSPAFFMFDPEGRKYVAGGHADGDQPVVAEIAGYRTPDNAFMTVPR
jgi:hypothetical protein